MTTIAPLSDVAREDLRVKIDASLLACNAARARGDHDAADLLWKEHIGLLEVSMGRTGSAARLTPEITPKARGVTE